MPRIDIDLSGFTRTRTELDRLALRQRTAEAKIASAKTALDAAVRSGASADERKALSARVASAQAARNALVTERRTLQNRMDELADGLVRNRDPSTLVGALDGHIPIALLPMRIETRYFRVPGQPIRLRIRIYPDDLNTIDHEPTPTADEQQAAMGYWRARFAHDDDEAARILRDLTTVLRPRSRALARARSHAEQSGAGARRGSRARVSADGHHRCARQDHARGPVAGALVRDRLCRGAARGLSRLGQHDSRRTGALAGLARDRRPRGPARWRPRVDGRLRRGAQERHGHRSDAGQDRAVAWHPLRSRHRHAGAAGRRRLRVDEERRGQRRRLHRPPRRASGFERPGIRRARHADQQHGGRAGGLQPELETICLRLPPRAPARRTRTRCSCCSGRSASRPRRFPPTTSRIRISRTSAPACT